LTRSDTEDNFLSRLATPLDKPTIFSKGAHFPGGTHLDFVVCTRLFRTY